MFGFIKRLFGIEDVSAEKQERVTKNREMYLKLLKEDVKPRKVTATSDYRSSTSYNSVPSSNDDNSVLDTVVDAMIINELLSGNDPVSSDSSFINEDSHGFDGGFGGGEYSGGGSEGSWDSSDSSSDNSYDSYDSSSDSSFDSFSSSDD